MYYIDFADSIVSIGGGGAREKKPSYWFYLLIDEYFSAETPQGKDLQQTLMIFDKSVCARVRVHMPHLGCEQAFRDGVLSRAWNHKEKKELEKTPGLLVMERSIKSFDPRSHSWIYINLLELMDESGHLRLPKVRDFLSSLATSIEKDDKIFKKLKVYIREQSVAEKARVFELKPNFCGIGIDIKEMVRFIKNLRR